MDTARRDSLAWCLLCVNKEGSLSLPALMITVNSCIISILAYQIETLLTLALTGSLILPAVEGTGKCKNALSTWSWNHVIPKTRTSCHITPGRFSPLYAKKKKKTSKYFSSIFHWKIRLSRVKLVLWHLMRSPYRSGWTQSTFCSFRASLQSLVAFNPYPRVRNSSFNRWTYQNYLGQNFEPSMSFCFYLGA